MVFVTGEVGKNVSMTAVARKLDSIRDKGGLKDIDVANLLGIRRETVSRWNNGRAYPHGQSESALLELEYIIDQISDFFEPKEARQFVFSRQRILDDRTPAELIKSGEFDEVLAVIKRLRDGVFL